MYIYITFSYLFHFSKKKPEMQTNLCNLKSFLGSNWWKEIKSLICIAVLCCARLFHVWARKSSFRNWSRSVQLLKSLVYKSALFNVYKKSFLERDSELYSHLIVYYKSLSDSNQCENDYNCACGVGREQHFVLYNKYAKLLPFLHYIGYLKVIFTLLYKLFKWYIQRRVQPWGAQCAYAHPESMLPWNLK